MSKAGKKSGAPSKSGGNEGSPTFRPMEAQLRALAAKTKAEEAEKRAAAEAAKKAASQEQRAKAANKGKPTAPASASHTPTATRASTLTRDERRELDAMEKADRRDDEFFFARLMSGVVPLDDDKRGRVIAGAGGEKKRAVVAAPTGPDPDELVRDQLMNLVEGQTRFEVSDDGRRLDLPDLAYRKLRRGEFPIDARLDMHGLRADEAKAALEKFLDEKRARKDRTVLVIHGRGDHSPAGIGVLRGEIAAWLSQGRPSRHVAAFATAHADDGGEGALYVLLRS
jgi:DNA-nicking Smr family endonuclease